MRDNAMRKLTVVWWSNWIATGVRAAERTTMKPRSNGADVRGDVRAALASDEVRILDAIIRALKDRSVSGRPLH